MPSRPLRFAATFDPDPDALPPPKVRPRRHALQEPQVQQSPAPRTDVTVPPSPNRIPQVGSPSTRKAEAGSDEWMQKRVDYCVDNAKGDLELTCVLPLEQLLMS
jgi:hypothetical protein